MAQGPLRDIKIMPVETTIVIHRRSHWQTRVRSRSAARQP